MFLMHLNLLPLKTLELKNYNNILFYSFEKMALLPQFTYNLYLNPVLLKCANLTLKVIR